MQSTLHPRGGVADIVQEEEYHQQAKVLKKHLRIRLQKQQGLILELHKDHTGNNTPMTRPVLPKGPSSPYPAPAMLSKRVIHDESWITAAAQVSA